MKGRFLVVNLDKHQDDVVMCSSIADEDLTNANDHLTMLVDVEQERVYVGGSWRPMTYKVVPFGLVPKPGEERRRTARTFGEFGGCNPTLTERRCSPR